MDIGILRAEFRNLKLLSGHFDKAFMRANIKSSFRKTRIIKHNIQATTAFIANLTLAKN
jgi:hypothetical protein